MSERLTGYDLDRKFIDGVVRALKKSASFNEAAKSLDITNTPLLNARLNDICRKNPQFAGKVTAAKKVMVRNRQRLAGRRLKTKPLRRRHYR